MIISYLLMFVYPKSVLEYHISNLSHLIRFCHGPFGLEVHDFLDGVTCEDMMVAFYPFSKPKMRQKLHKL